MKMLVKAYIREQNLDDLIFAEIGVLQRAEHRSIVNLIEILEDAGSFYFIMEVLQGKNLQELTFDDDHFNEK